MKNLFYFTLFTITILTVSITCQFKNKFSYTLNKTNLEPKLKVKHVKLFFQGESGSNGENNLSEANMRVILFTKKINNFITQKIDSLSQDTTEIYLRNIPENAKIKIYGSFFLKIETNKIIINATNQQGFLNGLNELERKIKTNKAELKIESKEYRPKIQRRIAHIVILPNTSVKKLKSYIDHIRLNNYNYMILAIRNRVALSSMKGISINESMSKRDFIEVVNYALKYDISIIPEVNFLTHQEGLFSNKDFLYNKFTYDPRNKKIYPFLYDIIDELIEICKPVYFHIGHDELAGLWKAKHGKLEKTEKILPADLFVEDILTLNQYINSKNLVTLMWADMLLLKSDFPKMKDKAFNADQSYKESISKIPKNIILCDWRYFELDDFSTFTYLTNNGFSTFGASWLDKESNLAYINFIEKNFGFSLSGFITTTWEGSLRKVNENRNLKFTVENILTNSAPLMWHIN